MVKICFLARVCKIAECPEYSKALLVVFIIHKMIHEYGRCAKLRGFSLHCLEDLKIIARGSNDLYNLNAS